jgi:hypothetical protein
MVERLAAMDNAKRLSRYSSISGMPVSQYTGVLEVKLRAGGSSVEWHSQFRANNQPDLSVKVMVATLLKTGLESLKTRFGAAK